MLKDKNASKPENDFIENDFIVEQEGSHDSGDTKNLYIDGQKIEEDVEFIEFLVANLEYPKAPQEIIEKAMEGYTKHYRYKIIWWDIKTKLTEWRKFLPLLNVQKITVTVSVLLLFAILGTVHYQYKNQYINTSITNKKTLSVTSTSDLTENNQIENNQTRIKDDTSEDITSKKNSEIRLLPNSLNSSSEKNNSKILSTRNQNNHTTKNQKQPNKIEKPKSNPLNETLDDSQMAHNLKPKDFTNIEDVSKDVLRSVLVDISLLEINQIYVDSFGDKEEDKLLRQALIERLKNTDFELLTASQSLSTDTCGNIIKQGDLIQIVNSSTNSLLWYKSIRETRETSGSFKDVANSLVNSLLEDIRSQQK